MSAFSSFFLWRGRETETHLPLPPWLRAIATSTKASGPNGVSSLNAERGLADDIEGKLVSTSLAHPAQRSSVLDLPSLVGGAEFSHRPTELHTHTP
jgi:hypothetical protein